MLEEEISLWRKNFGVALDVWSNKMSLEFSINKIFSSWVTIFLPVPNPSCHQLGHANKIIRSSYPPCRQLRSVGSSKTGFPKSSHRLHPTKDLFDPFSYPLAYTVAPMTSRSCIDGRAAFALGVGRYMRENLSPAQKIDKVVGVVTFIASQRFYPQPFSSLALKHALGRFPLTAPGGLADQKIDQQAISVLHQGMRPVTKLRLFSRPLTHQTTVGIGRRLMGFVASFLAVKIHPAVSRISPILGSRPIFSLGSKAPAACPGLDQSPIHRKMIVAHQPGSSGLPNHRLEKQTPHLVLHQPLAVLAENRGIEAFFDQLYVQKPTKQQIVVQLLAKLPLASHRVKRDQQQRLQNLLGCHRGPSHCGIHSIKNPRQFQKLLIRHCLDFSKRMIGGNTPLYRDQSQHAYLPVLRSPHSGIQRYNLRHLNMRHDLQSRKNFKTRSFSASC